MSKIEEEDWVFIKRPGTKERNFKHVVKDKLIPSIEKAIISASLEPLHEQFNGTPSVEIYVGEIGLETLKISMLKDEDIDVDENFIIIHFRDCAAILKEFPWRYSSSLLEDAGKAKTKFNRVTITVKLSYSVEKFVFLNLKLEHFHLEIHDLEIIVSDARRGYIYDFLLRIFSSRINKMISDAISQAVRQNADIGEVSIPWIKALTMT